MKSANVMVSSDGRVLITDFGFATVGHFGPPPPPPSSSQQTNSNFSMAALSSPAKPTPAPATKGVTQHQAPPGAGVQGDDTGIAQCDVPPPHRYNSDIINEGLGSAAEVATKDEVGNAGAYPVNTPTLATSRADVVYSRNAGETKRNRPSTRTSIPVSNYRVQEKTSRLKGGSAGRGGADSTRDEGEVEGDSAIDETHDHRSNVLYGTLKGYTPRYRSPEICAILAEKAGSRFRGELSGSHLAVRGLFRA